MGVSFIGIATKATEKELLVSLQNTNIQNGKDVHIVFDSEHYFETIILRKPSDNLIDIYSCPNGSLCTVSYNVYDNYLWKSDISKLFDLLYFDVSETSMDHRFAFFSGGSEKYGMNVYDEGATKRIHGDNFLNIRDSDDIFTGTFAAAVNEYLPKAFGEMLETGPPEKVRRYKLLTQPPGQSEEPAIEIKKKSFFGKLFNK